MGKIIHSATLAHLCYYTDVTFNDFPMDGYPSAGNESELSKALSNFKPLHVFIFGIVGGILVLCTIGFFILLSIMLKGGIALGAGSNNAGAVNQPSVAAPTDDGAAPANISLRAVDPRKDHVRGAKNPKITIVEYSDFECPYCKRFHETMLEVMKKYSGSVQWVYRNFPLESLHSKAPTEALASECASEQGKFWEFADLIFKVTNSNDSLDLSQLPNYAKQIGLNVPQFQKCIDDKKYVDKVNADAQDAQSAGARGTPYSVVLTPDGQKIPISGAQPFAAIEATIQQFVK